jgi:hypothetical protein
MADQMQSSEEDEEMLTVATTDDDAEEEHSGIALLHALVRGVVGSRRNSASQRFPSLSGFPLPLANGVSSTGAELAARIIADTRGVNQRRLCDAVMLVVAGSHFLYEVVGFALPII